MRRILKMVGIITVLVIILAISIGSVAMAAGPNLDPGTCPNTECPNPDCPRDGEPLQFQKGPLGPSDGGHQYQYKHGQKAE